MVYPQSKKKMIHFFIKGSWHCYKFTHDKCTFVTTNYDNVIEDYWVTERGYSDLYLGFQKRERKVMNADTFLLNNTDDAHPNNAMQLVKLHGSGNWVKNKYREIEEREYNTSLDDIQSRSGSMDIQEVIIKVEIASLMKTLFSDDDLYMMGTSQYVFQDSLTIISAVI